jgi:methionyl aminopeptidase
MATSTIITLKSRREIKLMRRAGLLVWLAHQAAGRLIRPGVTTKELDTAIADVFQQAGAEPLFLNYRGEVPFPAVTCISVNEEVVHGIPGQRELKEGDIVSLDTGCRINGWCGDAAITHAVGEVSATSQKLMDITLGALNLAIDQMPHCAYWSEVATQMADHVSQAGFSVVDQMVGHAIGKEMHEKPQVPNYFTVDMLEDDFRLKPGMVLAIEPMVNVGTNELVLLDDKWTLVTKDGKRSAHFEHTVALTNEGTRRLTGPPDLDELELMPPEFRDPDTWIRW